MAGYDDPEEALFRGYLDEKTTPATTQETLDNLALASMFAPVVGDVAGGVADIYRLYNNPEERTPLNYGLMGMGMLPFVPNMGITKRIKDAGTGLASTVAQNLPNKLPNWYSGGIPGQIDSVARLAGTGSLNTARQYLTPTGQAMGRENLPVTLKAVADKQYRIAEEAIVSGKAKIDEINARPDLSDKAKKDMVDEVQQATNKTVSAAGKTIEGQRGYSDLLNKQYGTSTPMIDDAMRSTNLSTGTFDQKTFNDMFPDAPEGVFEKIAQNQKMVPGEGVMVERKVTGNAAGDLRGDVLKKSNVADKINKAFSKQAPAETFTGFASFKQAIDYGKLTEREKGILESPEVKRYLQSAFRGDSPLKNAKTAEEFHSILKNSGIKVPKSLVAKAFRRSNRKPFADNAEMIAALEAEGLKILPENKKRALEGGPLIMSDAIVTGALDLGGANVVHVVKPNGRKMTYINDENDIWGVAPPGGKRLVSVASFSEDLLSPSAGSGELLKSSGDTVRTVEPSPFHNMTNVQKKNAEDLRNYTANPLTGDYARAFKNQLLVGGGAGGLGYAVFGEDEEE